jgi:hypothetical protein
LEHAHSSATARRMIGFMAWADKVGLAKWRLNWQTRAGLQLIFFPALR